MINVAVVDDHPMIIDGLKSLIDGSGKALVTGTALTGKACMQMLISQQPDVLLLDINLPDISGIDLLTLIKKEQRLKDIPVVILTGSNEDQDIQKCYDLGASSYLVKPISNGALMLVVEKLFDQ